MNSLLDNVLRNSAIWIIVLSTAVLILTAAVVRLSVTSKRFYSRWQEVLRDSSVSSLDLMLQDHLRERLALQEKLHDAERRIAVLETKMATAKRHLGVVRYDAFEDVGGAQSFALAIYDDHGNGAVLNGLIGRTDSRVYCKPLVGGRSDRELSQEEGAALDAAVSKAPKAVITT